MPTLYSFGNAANVSSNNFTTLYSSGAGVVTAQGAYGNANVVGLLAAGTDGGNTVGNIISSGNVTAQYFFGNIVGNIVGNLSVPGSNTEILFNNSGNAGASANLTFNSATSTLTVNGVVTATGNITSAANVSGAFILGNGSQLTGLPAGYSNAQVASYLSSGNLTSNIVTTANISGGFILGNGSQLTGLPAGYSNAQVASYLSSGTLASNIITTANVAGTYFIGNGSQLTGIAGTYGNANVVSLLASFGSNVISTTGNITGGNISAIGNVTISGSLNSDDITSAGVTVYGDQVITGNLTVQGTTTTINSNVITTNDKTITVANNQSTSANVNGAGLEAGNPAVATLLYNALTNSWQSNVGVTPVGNLVQELGNNQNRWSTVYSGIVNTSNVVANVIYSSNAITTNGPISAIGNISTMQYFFGNGAFLTGIASSYGNANVAANLAAFGSNPISSTGNITTTANISGGFFFGNGSQLTGIAGTYSNANVASYLASGLVTSNIITTANVSGTWLLGTYLETTQDGTINGNLHVSGGISAIGSLIRAGTISTSGNITVNPSSFYLGNGSQLTGLPDGYSNVKVADYLASGTINSNIITTANVTGGNITTTGLVSTTSNVVANNVHATVQVTAAGVTAQYINANAASGTALSIPTANASIGGLLSVTGNITSAANIAGTFFIGNGSQLTGLPATYGNANVATYLASGTNTSNIITTGNITGANITTGGVISATGTITTGASLVAPIVSVTAASGTGLDVAANARVSGLFSATGNITSAANITGAFFIGNGSQLTGLPATYSNANVATFLAAFGSNVISTTGNITGGNLNLDAPGALRGTGAYVNYLTANGSGTGLNVSNNAIFGGTASATGNISTGAFFIGNGSLLTGIAASYGNANVAANLAAFGNNPISTSGNITAGNFIGSGAYLSSLPAGNISGTVGLAQYVTQAAQANITSVGTLTSLTSTGNISTTGNITGGFLFGNGSQLTGITTSYGNANVAANLAAFGSNPISSTGNITTTANISGSFFLGNGSQLTGITASLPSALTGASLSVTGNVTGNVFTSQVYSIGTTSGTITPDITQGAIQTITLNGNITLNSLGNVVSGQSMTLIINQDATGNRLLTSTWKFAGNVRTLSTAASSTDMISVTYIGTTYYASLIRGFL